MKTYNLTTGTFKRTIGDKTCHCALGILLEERSPEWGWAADGYRLLREDLAADVGVMAEFLRKELDGKPVITSYDIDQVYEINDQCELPVQGTARPMFPAELIKRMLEQVGIEVELNDVRFRSREILNGDL